jgi:hypothetical protein
MGLLVRLEAVPEVFALATVLATGLMSLRVVRLQRVVRRVFCLFRGGFSVCAPVGIRTPNLLIRSQMLYPLSYRRIVKQPEDSRGGGQIRNQYLDQSTFTSLIDPIAET